MENGLLAKVEDTFQEIEKTEKLNWIRFGGALNANYIGIGEILVGLDQENESPRALQWEDGLLQYNLCRSTTHSPYTLCPFPLRVFACTVPSAARLCFPLSIKAPLVHQGPFSDSSLWTFCLIT